MATGVGDEHLRRLIADYFGRAARLRQLRATAAFGAPVFVVDFDRGTRHYRTFGSFGPSFGAADPEAPQVTEQSSMDMLYPAQLVFHYERLMSLAFALAERPVTALLLGVGGAAMWRFLRAYLPECAPTLVEADDGVAAIARRWFYLSQPVVIDTAERFLAGNTQHFDVVLVDLYDSRGPARPRHPRTLRGADRLPDPVVRKEERTPYRKGREGYAKDAKAPHGAKRQSTRCAHATRRGFAGRFTPEEFSSASFAYPSRPSR